MEKGKVNKEDLKRVCKETKNEELKKSIDKKLREVNNDKPIQK